MLRFLQGWPYHTIRIIRNPMKGGRLKSLYDLESGEILVGEEF